MSDTEDIVEEEVEEAPEVEEEPEEEQQEEDKEDEEDEVDEEEREHVEGETKPRTKYITNIAPPKLPDGEKLMTSTARGWRRTSMTCRA
jgi:hypothetical protein